MSKTFVLLIFNDKKHLDELSFEDREIIHKVRV